MVEPGDEYYLHIAIWKTVPFTFTMEENTGAMDIAIQRVIVEESLEECNSNANYSFIGRLYYNII